MLEFSIDEMTIVVQLSSKNKSVIRAEDWINVAKNMVADISTKGNFEEIYGKKNVVLKNLPEGYTFGYTFGEHNFYIVIAFHEIRIDMGLIVKFSAQALDYYCSESGVSPYTLLQMMQDNNYATRLSRVDFAVDYVDENVDVTEIYNDLIAKKIGIFREYISKKNEVFNKKTDMIIRGYLRENEVPTLYVGSVQSSSRLRIYDKKLEQTEKYGNKYDKAQRCKNWVRFEAVFRNTYAHQIGEELLKMSSDDELCNFIACTMVSKYKFLNIINGVADSPTDFTLELMNCISKGVYILKSYNTKNYELLRSVIYLLNGSGIMSTLYKIKKIWGDDALLSFLKFLYEFLDEFVPNSDCETWLRKNMNDYAGAFPTFGEFFRFNVEPTL